MSVRQEMDSIVTAVIVGLVAMVVLCIVGQVALNIALAREEAQRKVAVSIVKKETAKEKK